MQFYYYDQSTAAWVQYSSIVPEGAQLQYDAQYGYFLDGYGYTDGQMYLDDSAPPLQVNASHDIDEEEEEEVASPTSEFAAALQARAQNLKKVAVPEQKPVSTTEEDDITKNLQKQLDKFRMFVKEDEAEQNDEDWF
jgi:hypothetical protein